MSSLEHARGADHFIVRVGAKTNKSTGASWSGARPLAASWWPKPRAVLRARLMATAADSGTRAWQRLRWCQIVAIPTIVDFRLIDLSTSVFNLLSAPSRTAAGSWTALPPSARLTGVGQSESRRRGHV